MNAIMRRTNLQAHVRVDGMYVRFKLQELAGWIGYTTATDNVLVRETANF